MLNKLRQALTVLFNYCGKTEKDKDIYDLYYKTLKNHDIETVVKRIEYLISTKKDTFLPAIGLILESLIPSIETEMERDWNVFLRTRCNNLRYLPIPDWVYTIKQQLGEKRCEDFLESEIQYIKRDFEKAYPIVKKGLIPLLKDPLADKYYVAGNTTLLLSEDVNTNQYPELMESINGRMLIKKQDLIEEGGEIVSEEDV